MRKFVKKDSSHVVILDDDMTEDIEKYEKDEEYYEEFTLI